MFQKCSHEAVQSIITNLKMEIYLPGDYVVTYGSVGDTFSCLHLVDAIFEQERGVRKLECSRLTSTLGRELC